MQNTSSSKGTNQIPVNCHSFKVLKTIKLGTGPRTADEFQRAIVEAGRSISDWGRSILHDSAFAVRHEEVDYEIIIASNTELGLTGGAEVRDTYARALELGLEPCFIELGPRLCLEGEECYLGMEPVVDAAGNGNVFLVKRGNSGEYRLHGEYCNLSDFMSADKCFVFMRRKKIPAL